MSAFKKITYKNSLAKLEVFDKNHKLFKSMPVHKKALELGLRVPELYHIEEKNGRFFRTTEWVKGKTIHEELSASPSMIEPICMDLARYISELRDVGGMSPVDNHFKNFVWNNQSVVYIDLKKLWLEEYDEHIHRMSKLCLKNCKGENKRRMIKAFLRGYAMYGDVRNVIAECDKRNWQWQDKSVDPIEFGEL